MIQGGEECIAKKRDATVVPFEGRVKARLSDSAAQPPTLQQSHFSARVTAQMAVASLAIRNLKEHGSSLREVSGEAARLDLHLEILDKCSVITFLLQMFIDETRRVNAGSEGASPGGCEPQDETTSASAFSAEIISLSSRERGILELIAHGYSNKGIARQIGITAETVKSHVKRIFIKLNVERRAQAVWRAQTLRIFGSK
jgi:LuxR family transcriptional regulator, maltose regulon positive regulatory protein